MDTVRSSVNSPRNRGGSGAQIDSTCSKKTMRSYQGEDGSSASSSTITRRRHGLAVEDEVAVMDKAYVSAAPTLVCSAVIVIDSRPATSSSVGES